MKTLRRTIINIVLVCIVLVGITTLIPQNAKAADNKFIVKKGVLVKYSGSDKKITIPKNVKAIKKDAFYDCKSLQTVTIPGNVKKVGESAFCGCSNLKKVVMKNGVTTIMLSAFSGCGKLNSITFPKSIKKIEGYAFEDTPWLTKARKRRKDRLVIVNNTLIDGRTAKGKVTIPKGVTDIVEDAFGFNSKLNGVTLPPTVKTVGAGAFRLTNIKKITFPKSVKSIGVGALCLCDRLKEVTILNPKAKLMWDNEYDKGTMFSGLSHFGEGFVNNKITIKGYKNSTAAKFAKYNNNLSNKSISKRYKKIVFKSVK